MIYFLLLSLGVLGMIGGNINVSARKVFAFFFMGGMVFVCVFRYDVGMDYTAYTEIFQYVGLHTLKERETEVGFALLCKLCYYLGGTSQLMFTLIGMLSLILIYCSINRFSSNILFSLFIFLCLGQLYLNSFNAIRQFLAISIFSYSLKYVVNKKLTMYILMLLLATTFHTTSLILIPLFWLLRCKLSFKWQCIFLACVIFSGPIIIYLIDNSPYRMYLTFEMYSTEVSIVNYVYLLLGFGIFVFQKKLMLGYKYRDIFLNLNYMALILFIYYFIFSGTPMTMVVIRLSYYFVFFYCITIVCLLRDIQKMGLRSICTLSTILILSGLFIRTTILLGSTYNLLPYQFNFKLFV